MERGRRQQRIELATQATWCNSNSEAVRLTFVFTIEFNSSSMFESIDRNRRY